MANYHIDLTPAPWDYHEIKSSGTESPREGLEKIRKNMPWLPIWTANIFPLKTERISLYEWRGTQCQGGKQAVLILPCQIPKLTFIL